MLLISMADRVLANDSGQYAFSQQASGSCLQAQGANYDLRVSTPRRKLAFLKVAAKLVSVVVLIWLF